MTLVSALFFSLIACTETEETTEKPDVVTGDNTGNTGNTDADALTLEISNYSGYRLNYVYAYDHSEETIEDLLGSDVLEDGDVGSWTLDEGVWSFYAIDADYYCAAAEEIELQDDQGGYYWKITSLDYDCSSLF